MKVILLAPTPPPRGGIAGWTLRMLNSSPRNGWEFDVVDEKLLGNRNVFGDNIKRNYFIEIKRTLRIWRDLIYKLKDRNVNIVHSNIPASNLGMLREIVCAIITKIYRRRFVIHYRCTVPNMVNSNISINIFRLLTNLSDLAIVLNKESETFTKKNTKTNVVVIPNFIDKTELVERSLDFEKKKISRAIYVGGVIEEKGCYEILNVAKKFPDIDFRLIGKYGRDIPELISSNNITLLGEKNKDIVKKELLEADVFLFLSYFNGEGFSNALLEAMASGLPCIASDWAANKDMIENKGGFIIPPKDEESLAKALLILSNNTELREKQSIWNLEKVKNNYIDSIVIDRYIDEYEKILSGDR